MTQTFDIRFARAGGLGALLESPANSFGWKGAGLLSIDSQGIRIDVKRSVASLLGRQQSKRIAAESITEVYRAGDSLRVEFATTEKPRAILPFWVRDRDTAVRIVQLLPTTRTFEIEQDPVESSRNNASRYAALFLVLVLVTAGGALLFGVKATGPTEAQTPAASAVASQSVEEFTPAPLPALAEATAAADPTPEPVALVTPKSPAPDREHVTPTAEATVDSPPPTTPAAVEPKAEVPRLPPPSETATPETDGFVPSVPAFRARTEDLVIPIQQGTLAYDAARGMLERFESGATDLTDGYRRQRELVDSGRLSSENFADRLDAYETRWRELSLRVLDSREARDPALTGLRATLLAVANYQSTFLAGYSAGLRKGDAQAIRNAFSRT